jgi:L-alanine-DL-glutamate epimerase-like enolase superfamily enzyme
MRITEVKPFAFWGGGRNYFFVKVETDDGLYGIGEGGVTWREMACAEAVNHLKPLLVGEEASRIEHLWQLMFRGGFFPGDRILCSAIAAIDIALWDLRGKALGVPVYELLGGKVRDRVVCYPHAVGGTPEELAAHSRSLAAEGWKFIRFGLPSNGPVLDASWATRMAVKQFAAVREAVGEEIEICIDVHTRLDPPDAIRLCRELEPYRPFFIEDPLRCENMHSFHALARHVAAPLAAGEQFATKWEFRELIEEDLIQYCRIDPCICGGITESRKIAAWCETHYIALAPHNPLGPVATAACLHLDLATSNFAVQEQPRVPGTLLPEIFPVQVPFADGHLLPPDRPGLGVEFDEEAASRCEGYRPGDAPLLQRSDGSFTNW